MDLVDSKDYLILKVNENNGSLQITIPRPYAKKILKIKKGDFVSILKKEFKKIKMMKED